MLLSRPAYIIIETAPTAITKKKKVNCDGFL
jgi:hypothetical protein